jgi:hypothetical protein
MIAVFSMQGWTERRTPRLKERWAKRTEERRVEAMDGIMEGDFCRGSAFL